MIAWIEDAVVGLVNSGESGMIDTRESRHGEE